MLLRPCVKVKPIKCHATPADWYFGYKWSYLRAEYVTAHAQIRGGIAVTYQTWEDG